MKKDNILTIILIIIIIILTFYILYDKLFPRWEYFGEEKKEVTKIVDQIEMDYVTIYLCDDKTSYIKPINNNEIDKLNVGNNLKERLNTLYDNAIYYNIYINDKKLKAYKVELSDKINKIKRIDTKNNKYVLFIKNDNTVGLFNYEDYYNLMYTKVIDNYKDYKNVVDIKNNELIMLDKSTKLIELNN